MSRHGTVLTRNERIFGVANNVLMAVLIVLMVYPLWHILMYSLSDVSLAARGGIFLLPRGFCTDTYRAVLSNRMVVNGFKVSGIVTVVGACGGTLLTALTAYPLAKTRLRGRKGLTFYLFFTMIFSGGMIPSYLLIKELNLIDTYGALILPGMLNAWNVFLMKNFFLEIPDSLEESAKIDGASDWVILFKIILPISMPVIATILLFSAVGYWNSYFSTILYINDSSMWQLQAVLRDIISNATAAMQRQGVNIPNQYSTTPQTVMMAAVVVTTFPILLVYPFLQKYFVKGVMVGSIKA